MKKLLFICLLVIFASCNQKKNSESQVKKTDTVAPVLPKLAYYVDSLRLVIVYRVGTNLVVDTNAFISQAGYINVETKQWVQILDSAKVTSSNGTKVPLKHVIFSGPK